MTITWIGEGMFIMNAQNIVQRELLMIEKSEIIMPEPVVTFMAGS